VLLPANRSGLLAFLIATALLKSALVSAATIPDWVRQASVEVLGSYPAETKALILLSQTDYTVTGPGQYIEHSRRIARILRPEGRAWGDLVVDLRQGEKLNSIHAWTVDRSGRDYELKQKDFTEKSLSSDELYSDIRFLNAQAPAAELGSLVAFEFEVRRHAYVNEINRFFQEVNPVRELRITLTLPQGWEFHDSWPEGYRMTARQLAANRWEWTAHELEGIREEPAMPDKSVLLGRLSIAYFAPGERTATSGSWSALGQWYDRLTAGRRDPTPEIVREVEQRASPAADFASRLEALTRFVQTQIRYVGIEIGIGGYQPHLAREVFYHRYGDCKDKATLLSSMLKVAGIDSDYVLIDTDRGFVNPAVPSVWFDHVIVAIEIPAGTPAERYAAVVASQSGKRYIIFDPTDEYTPVGSLRPDLQNSDALLIRADGGELIRTPLLSPERNRITRTGHFVLMPDGRLSGEVTEDRSGDLATRERRNLHYADERRRTDQFERWLGRSLQGFSLEAMEIQKAEEIDEELSIRYKFTAPQYAQMRGSLLLIRPRVLDQKGSYVEHKLRHYPLQLDSTADEIDVFEIELPREYQVDDLPDSVKIDVGFAGYESRIRIEGSKLRYWREYVVRDVTIPSEKYQEWTRLQEVIGSDEAAAVVLKRVSP
jgi:hypothetical protein